MVVRKSDQDFVDFTADEISEEKFLQESLLDQVVFSHLAAGLMGHWEVEDVSRFTSGDEWGLVVSADDLLSEGDVSDVLLDHGDWELDEDFVDFWGDDLGQKVFLQEGLFDEEVFLVDTVLANNDTDVFLDHVDGESLEDFVDFWGDDLGEEEFPQEVLFDLDELGLAEVLTDVKFDLVDWKGHEDGVDFVGDDVGQEEFLQEGLFHEFTFELLAFEFGSWDGFFSNLDFDDLRKNSI